MKRKLLFTAGLIAAVFVAPGMASTLCISGGTVSSISGDPAAGANSWKMNILKNDGLTTVTVKSDPQKSIDLDTAQGWAVFSIARVAYMSGAPVDVFNTTGNDCSVFDELDTR